MMSTMNNIKKKNTIHYPSVIKIDLISYSEFS